MPWVGSSLSVTIFSFILNYYYYYYYYVRESITLPVKLMCTYLPIISVLSMTDKASNSKITLGHLIDIANRTA